MRSFHFVIPSVLPTKQPLRYFLKRLSRIFHHTTQNLEIGAGEDAEDYVTERRAGLESYLKALIKYYKGQDRKFWNHPVVLQFFDMKPICKLQELQPFDKSENLQLMAGDTVTAGGCQKWPRIPSEQDKMALQDAQLETLGSHVKGQKEIATKIYEEVVLQNSLLDNIHEKVSSVSTTIEKHDERIKQNLL
jgi:hypothetical protein